MTDISQRYSRRKIGVIAVDADWSCINKLYQFTREHLAANILPLCVDITNPTPATGFFNAERLLSPTGPLPTGGTLALIHHLVLGKIYPCRRLPLIFQH